MKENGVIEMARYNREFLVPYLHNICALHLAAKKTYQQIRLWDQEISRLRDGVYAPAPEYPEFEAEYTGGRICLMLIGGFFLFCGVGLFFGSWIEEGGLMSMFLASLLVVALGVFLIWFSVGLVRETREKNEQKIREYQKQLDHHKWAKKENERMSAQIPNAKRERAGWVEARGRVEKLLQQAYAVNIIPRYYRELYPAVYLYDWFKSSQEDDVAMALNMFVLEEIKAKLDRIIENQSEIILNQYIQEANQRKEMEQRNDLNRQLTSRLDRISAQGEERNNYLRMIASTTAADAYFTATSYLWNV